MDKEIILTDSYVCCKDCNQEFCVTKGEKQFLKELVEKQTPRNDEDGNPIEGSEMKIFTLPIRCKECRRKRKAYFEANKVKQNENK